MTQQPPGASETPPPSPSPPPVPPGWYPDPWHAAPRRYWDGVAWTGHTDTASAYASVAATTAKDDPLRMLLPIGRSGWAIAAGYLGLVSVLCIFAPFALATGVLALREIGSKPELMGRGRAWFGIVMGAIFTIVLVVALVGQATK